MDTSLEIRWFCQGDIPANVHDWFLRVAPRAVQEPSRTDLYLLTQSTAFGIKHRQGCFEIKKRTPVVNDASEFPILPGTVEQWEKWSFPLIPDDPTMPPVDDPQHWAAVHKSRAILRYQFISGAPLIPMPVGQIPQQGGAIELAKVHVNGHAWWTVGIETHGSQDIRQQCFILLADKLLASPGYPAFSAKSAYSYPQWLLYVQQD